MEAAEYPVVALGLPSVGADPPKPDFGDDIAIIRSTVSDLISEGKRVVAVLHSYGGIAGTEALQKFGDMPRKGAGAVLGLIYIATMLPKKGDSFEAHLESVGDFGRTSAREALTVSGMMTLPPDIAAGMFYNDVEPEQSSRWTALLRPQSVGVFQSSITHETYRDIPSAYLLNTKDQAFRYEYQVKTVQRAGITATKILETGHSPFLSRPEEVKDFVVSFVAGLNI